MLNAKKYIGGFLVRFFMLCMVSLLCPPGSPAVLANDLYKNKCERLGLVEGSSDYILCVNSLKNKDASPRVDNSEALLKRQAQSVLNEALMYGMWSTDCISKKHVFNIYQDGPHAFTNFKIEGIVQTETEVVYAERYTSNFIKLKNKVTYSKSNPQDVGIRYELMYDIGQSGFFRLIESKKNNEYIVKNGRNIKTSDDMPTWKKCI